MNSDKTYFKDSDHFINEYASLRTKQKFTVRNFARKIALDTIGMFGHFKNEEAFKHNRIQFLYIHHTFKDEEEKLRRLLGFLAEHHSFISYSEAVKKILSNDIDKPYICFSSDDGFKNNLRGAKILEEFGISACFFICPSIINDKDYDHIKTFCAKKLELPPVQFLDWDDVDTLLSDGHEIGSHTMSHINLRKVSTSVLHDEIQSSYSILQKKIGCISHFAFPYGRYFHFSKRGRELVFETGYQSCASAERGCHVKQYRAPIKEELLIRRDIIILDWNLNHIKYFIRRNATHADLQHNNFIYK